MPEWKIIWACDHIAEMLLILINLLYHVDIFVFRCESTINTGSMALKLYHVFVLFTLCNTLQWCQEPHDLIISRRGTDWHCWAWYTFYHKQSDEVEQLGICIHFVKAYFTWSDTSSLYMLRDAVWMRSITLFHQPCMTFTFTVTTFPTVTEIVWLFYQILSYII